MRFEDPFLLIGRDSRSCVLDLDPPGQAAVERADVDSSYNRIAQVAYGGVNETGKQAFQHTAATRAPPSSRRRHLDRDLLLRGQFTRLLDDTREDRSELCRDPGLRL